MTQPPLLLDFTCYYIVLFIFLVPLFFLGFGGTAVHCSPGGCRARLHRNGVEWSGVEWNREECVCVYSVGRGTACDSHTLTCRPAGSYLAAHSTCVQTHLLCQQFTPVLLHCSLLLLCRCMPCCFSGMKMRLWRAGGGESENIIRWKSLTSASRATG